MFDQNRYDETEYAPEDDIQAASVDHNKIVSALKRSGDRRADRADGEGI